ncbi:ABC transporter substrate-binding protein [Streptomyces sp. NPDC002920]
MSSIAALAAAALVAGCGGSGSTGSSGADGNTLTLWTHNAGNAAEYGVVKQIVKDFNAGQSKYKVKIQAFPQGSCNDSVVAAASAKKLPCLLDVDGPNVPNWAWGGYLAPLDLSTGQVAVKDQLASTVATYKDKTYGFGFYDVALTMYSRKSVLKRYGIRIPTLDMPARPSPTAAGRHCSTSATTWSTGLTWAPSTPAAPPTSPPRPAGNAPSTRPSATAAS